MSDAVTMDYQSAGQSRSLDPEADPLWLGLPLSAWVKIGTVAALMAALFWPNLRRLWEKTNPFTGEANWGHAVCIPFVCIYYLYINRQELLAAAAVSKGSWAGLIIMLAGILVFGYGIWPGQNDFVKDFGMVVTLFGVVLLLAGWGVMKIAWFPIAFLVCGIPWPGLVYQWVAGPLQQLAAHVAVGVLSATGVRSFASGTKIIIYGYNGVQRTLNVAEACAGLRSLMTFISVGAAIAFLSARPLWQKITVTASAIPIAIFCNVMRVSGQGLLDHYVSPELSESFAHQFVGMVMLIPAFFMILGMGWILDQIFVEELDDASAALARQRVVRRAQNGAAPPRAGGAMLAVPRQAGLASRPPITTGERNSVKATLAPSASVTAPSAKATTASPPPASASPVARTAASASPASASANPGRPSAIAFAARDSSGSAAAPARPVPAPPPPNGVLARRKAAQKPPAPSPAAGTSSPSANPPSADRRPQRAVSPKPSGPEAR